MKCPVCQETLLMADRQGVEIDYCPTCRGVWLDRGELEKLIQASLNQTEAAPNHGGRRFRDDDDDDDRDRRDGSHDSSRYKRRESWLGRILDFD